MHIKIFIIELLFLAPICWLWVKGIDNTKDVDRDKVDFP